MCINVGSTYVHGPRPVQAVTYTMKFVSLTGIEPRKQPMSTIGLSVINIYQTLPSFKQRLDQIKSTEMCILHYN